MINYSFNLINDKLQVDTENFDLGGPRSVRGT